jgi:hypothetical protein
VMCHILLHSVMAGVVRLLRPNGVLFSRIPTGRYRRGRRPTIRSTTSMRSLLGRLPDRPVRTARSGDHRRSRSRCWGSMRRRGQEGRAAAGAADIGAAGEGARIGPWQSRTAVGSQLNVERSRDALMSCARAQRRRQAGGELRHDVQTLSESTTAGHPDLLGFISIPRP